MCNVVERPISSEHMGVTMFMVQTHTTALKAHGSHHLKSHNTYHSSEGIGSYHSKSHKYSKNVGVTTQRYSKNVGVLILYTGITCKTPVKLP